MAVVGRAHAAISLGQPAAADRLLIGVEGELRALEARWILAVALNTRGRAALLAGDHTRAAAPLREAAAILGRLQDRWAMRFTLTHLADVAALAANPRRAAMLYGAADVLIERNVSHFPVNQRLSERCRAAAEAEIGPDTFEAIHRQGRALPFDEVVALAGRPTHDRRGPPRPGGAA
jgi:hypothetical protein